MGSSQSRRMLDAAIAIVVVLALGVVALWIYSSRGTNEDTTGDEVVVADESVAASTVAVASSPAASPVEVGGGLQFRDYTPEAFAAAQADGTPSIVFVFAPWCPDCRAQMQVIQEDLAPDPRFNDVVVFMIDYDTEKPYMRMVRVAQRSTLIGYRNGEEIGRIYLLQTLEDMQPLFLSVVE
jgi:thioredoxin 1